MTPSPPSGTEPSPGHNVVDVAPESNSIAAVSHRWVPVVLPPLVALLTLGFTYLYWHSEERGALAKREQNFQVAADHIAHNLKDRMATYEVVLRGVKGYAEGSERIDRGEFQAYVGALQLQETRPGLRGVSLILRLPSAELGAHIADMRQRGFPSYTVWPDGERSFYAPITHIEPLKGDNVKVLGFDALTIPAGQAAMDRARDTGELTLSGPLTLRQDTARNTPPGQPPAPTPGW